MLPQNIINFIDAFKKLPGIGAKTAERLGFFLLSSDASISERIAHAILNLKKGMIECEICGNMDNESPCKICRDYGRDRKRICIVENILDLYTIEESQGFHGLYHVLGGLIDPLNGVTPNDLNTGSLIDRVKNEEISEIIFALSPTTEGETTQLYIMEVLKGLDLKFTQLARGIPVGTDLQYAGRRSLAEAIQRREEMKRF